MPRNIQTNADRSKMVKSARKSEKAGQAAVKKAIPGIVKRVQNEHDAGGPKTGPR